MSRPRTGICKVAVATVLTLLLAATGAGAAGQTRRSADRHPHLSPRDRAATRALLRAELAYYKALEAAAPASRAAAEKLADTLGGECPGVLTGAPHFGIGRLLESSENEHTTPRQEGEESREDRQWFTLEAELLLGLGQASEQPARSATTTYVHAVSGLTWTNPTVTTLEHASAAELEFELRAPPPSVCADMRSWVASAYKTLTPASKTIEGESEMAVGALTSLSLGQLAPLLGDPVRRYEGPRERALAREVRTLKRAQTRTAKTTAIDEQVERTLGLESQAESELRERPRKGSVEIAHERTISRRAFKVWLEPPRSGSSPLEGPACRLPVEIEQEEPQGAEEGLLSLNSQTCLTPGRRRAPSVDCDPRGLLVVKAQTLARTRRARLTLSDGREVSSRVALVPARLGGPVGLYFQVLRGPSPVPVSLTELGAHGKVLRVMKLPRTERCVKRSLLPTHVHVRTLARGALPGGPGYTIVGERSTFLGETHTVLRAEVTHESLLGFAFGLLGGGFLENLLGGTPNTHTAFALHHRSGCRPQEFTILYGVVKAPRDKVLVRVAGKLQALRRVKIPAVLHLHGALAYVALSGAPEEVIVRAPSGKTVARDDLAHEARSLKETCEGEAEG